MPSARDHVQDFAVLGNANHRIGTVFDAQQDVKSIAVVETLAVDISHHWAIVAHHPVALPLRVVRVVAASHNLCLVGAISRLLEVDRERRRIESERVEEGVALFCQLFLQAHVTAQVPVGIDYRFSEVGHFENLRIGNVSFHTSVGHRERIVTRFQAFAPQLVVHARTDGVREEFLRLGQRAVGSRFQIDSIASRSLLDVQTDTAVGTSRGRGHHIVRAHRGVKSVAIRRAERHRFLCVEDFRVVVLIVEHRGAGRNLIRSRFQTDKALRLRRSGGFGHIRVGRSGDLLQRVVHLVHIIEGLRHRHFDFTVVLTLHFIARCVKAKGWRRSGAGKFAQYLSGEAPREDVSGHSEEGTRSLHGNLDRIVGRYRLVVDLRTQIVRDDHLHCGARINADGRYRENGIAFRTELRGRQQYVCPGSDRRCGGLLSLCRTVIEVIHVVRSAW